MICSNCNIDRLVSDFINNQEYCYRCVFKKKRIKSTETRTPKKLKCRHCEEEIPCKNEAGKRQRSIYCSNECARLGHEKQLNNHWTRKIPKQFSSATKGRKSWNSFRRLTLQDKRLERYTETLKCPES